MTTFASQTSMPEPVVPEPWLLRLRAAYEGGFYRTEAAVGEQIPFPWQGKTCGDCPFWSGNVCQVYVERRSALAHTCCYFDRANQPAAHDIIESRAGASPSGAPRQHQS